jgi:hypothetical protein
MNNQKHRLQWLLGLVLPLVMLGFSCPKPREAGQGDSAATAMPPTLLAGDWSGLVGIDTCAKAREVAGLGLGAKIDVWDLHLWRLKRTRSCPLVDTLGAVATAPTLRELLQALDSIAASKGMQPHPLRYQIQHPFRAWIGWRLAGGGHLLQSGWATLYLPGGGTLPWIVQAHPVYHDPKWWQDEAGRRRAILAVYQVGADLMPIAALKSPLGGGVLETYHCVHEADGPHFWAAGAKVPPLANLRFETLDALFRTGSVCVNAHFGDWSEEQLPGLCAEPMWAVDDPGIGGILVHDAHPGCW